jgi:hypothetical protein
MMLVMSVVPHHHHNGAVCTIVEFCEDDNSVNDEHTGHSGNDMDHGKSCVIESDFVITQTDNREKCEGSYCDNPDHVHFLHILYLVSGILPNPVETTSLQPEYGEYVLFYTSAQASQFHGLRAPPFMLS